MPKQLKKLYKQLAKTMADIYEHEKTPPVVIQVLNDFRSDLDAQADNRTSRRVHSAEIKKGVHVNLELLSRTGP